MWKCVGACLIALSILNSTQERQPAKCVQVFYIPLPVQTYTPVGKTDVETRAHKTFTVCDKGDISVIDEAIAKAEATDDQLDERRIRVKIIHGDKVYYVDTKWRLGGWQQHAET